ncbi:MAG: fructose-6-phosphate aldolase [candidate division WOR-3 bacterium]
MKVFIDSADIDEIRRIVKLGFVSGVTTNPTLLSKTGKEPKEVYYELAQLVEHVSAEVVSEDAESMIKEGLEYASIHPNIVVKLPMTQEGLIALQGLKEKGVRVNMTLIFSPSQALLAARAGADFVSPFIGRIDDIGYYGIDLIKQVSQIFTLHGIETQIIAASIRHPLHFVEAALAGAHIATVPPEVIWKLIKHPLTDIGLEKFISDWKKSMGVNV